MRVEHAGSLHQRLDEVLEAAVAIARADFGTIELRDPRSGELHVAAQRGFSRDFIMSFEVSGDRTTVTSARPAGAGLPAAHVTSLPSRTGEPLGVLTTYYRSPYRPSEEACRLLDLLVRLVADCMDESRALRAAREELRQEQEARARAETASRTKDEFLATLAHELRQPLGTAFAAIALLRAGGGERPREVLEQQLQQMQRLLDDLGNPAQIARGTISIRRDRVDLCHVVRQAVEEAAPLCARRHHALRALLPPQSVWISADAARLRQVLSNLVQNAVFYTPPGGEISVALEVNEGRPRVRCRDTGVGIPSDALERIFELADRGAQPADARRAGIGLALVRRLVELHGGRIWASSAGPGHGSEFVVELPAEEPPPLPDSRPPHGTAGA